MKVLHEMEREKERDPNPQLKCALDSDYKHIKRKSRN